MNYPCNLIRDILPLYHDGVCSEESGEIVKAHLNECPGCKEYYNAMCGGDEAAMPCGEELEQQKAESFKAVKRRIRAKEIITAIVCAAVLLLAAVIGRAILKNTTETILYDYNISVSMTDSGLTARLSGSIWDSAHSKTVTARGKTYLLFYLTDSRWDALTKNSKVFSEYTLCPADKGAENIDFVYYYSGVYEGIEMLTEDEIAEIIEGSVLLWSK